MEDINKVFRKIRGYWTLEKCQEDALKYQSKNEWRKNSTAYDTVRRNGWIIQCSNHFMINKNPNNYWTLQRCKIEAQKFDSKTLWCKNSSSSYCASLNNNWMDECSKHMTKKGSRYKRLIYAFEFSDKSVYVGLTYNSHERKKAHLNNQISQVYKYIQKSGLNPTFIELTDFFEKDIATVEEGKFLEKYKNDGWKILNKSKTGALGSTTIKWTKDKCIEEVKKYTLITEWKYKSSGSFKSAIRNNWINECKQIILNGRH